MQAGDPSARSGLDGLPPLIGAGLDGLHDATLHTKRKETPMNTPIERAQALTPVWMKTLHEFDGLADRLLEVWPHLNSRSLMT